MTSRHLTRHRPHRVLDRLGRLVRYKLIVPVLRSRRAPEFTARGVAIGLFWGLTPSVGFQTIAILSTWLAVHRVLRRESSLLQALIWAWVNNPITMIPMYYMFYVTGLWLTGVSGSFGGYDTFVQLWRTSQAAASWLDRVRMLAREVGVPLVVGCMPYALTGSAIGYRWALMVVRHRRETIRPSSIKTGAPRG